MSWSSLQTHAEEMGFEIALRTRHAEGGGFVPDITSPGGEGWLLIGNYEHVAGFWVKPLTDSARKMPGAAVRRLMAEGDPFVEEVGEYDAEFFAANEPLLAALRNLERISE
jgi:hypothetical protein